MKNDFFRELEALDHRINELLADENRTSNTDSRFRLLDERDRKMEELTIIFNAERATLTQSNPRDGNFHHAEENFHQAEENYHQAEENVE